MSVRLPELKAEVPALTVPERNSEGYRRLPVSGALALAASGRTMWYLTRGSGVVTLLLLTASMCLGNRGTLCDVRTRRLPRFTVAALHRNLTLLAVVFLGVHVVTTLADSYTPIGWKDAFVPFLSPYRPIWLGLGALALDLSARPGDHEPLAGPLRPSRLAPRPLARLRVLAACAACTPSGPAATRAPAGSRLLAAVSVAAVMLAVAARLIRGRAVSGRRLALGGAALVVALVGGAWYRGGPGATGWAARAGTPATLLHSTAP